MQFVIDNSHSVSIAHPIGLVVVHRSPEIAMQVATQLPVARSSHPPLITSSIVPPASATSPHCLRPSVPVFWRVVVVSPGPAVVGPTLLLLAKQVRRVSTWRAEEGGSLSSYTKGHVVLKLHLWTKSYRTNSPLVKQ